MRYDRWLERAADMAARQRPFMTKRTRGPAAGILCVMSCLLLWGGPCFAGRTPNEKLIEAATQGNLAAVAKVLTEGAVDVNERDSLGYTALHKAVIHRHREVVDTLIARGADINAEPTGESYIRSLIGIPIEKQGTVLHMACATAQMDLAERLIAAGADVNAKAFPLGSTPLHVAIRNCASHQNQSIVKQLVKLLIAKGADVNSADNIGDKPLDYACCREQEEIVALLLDSGAEVATHDQDGRTSFNIVTAIACPYAIKALLAKDAGVKALLPAVFHLACFKGRKQTVEILLSHGVDINARDNIGFRSLKERVDASRDPYLAALRGAVGDSRPLFGLIGLHRIGIKRSFRMSRASCYEAKDVQTKGATALHWASLGNRADVAEFLLAKGAHIHAMDENGHTALHVASAVHGPKVVQVLLANGADVNARDNEGTTPLGWATKTWKWSETASSMYRDYCDFSESDYKKVKELLKAHGAQEPFVERQ